jgi:hypothetical protein
MSKIENLRNFPEMLVKNEQMWKNWYELEAPEAKPFPDAFDQRLTKFQRLLVVCRERKIEEREREKYSNVYIFFERSPTAQLRSPFFIFESFFFPFPPPPFFFPFLFLLLVKR